MWRASLVITGLIVGAGIERPSHLLDRGVVIDAVSMDSGAARAGLEQGDLVLAWSRGESKAALLRRVLASATR